MASSASLSGPTITSPFLSHSSVMPSYFGPTLTPMNHTYPHLSLGFDLESAHTLSDLPALGNYLLSAKRPYENPESSPEDAYPSPPSTISRGRSRRPALFTASVDDVPNDHVHHPCPTTIFYPPSPPPSAVRLPISLPEPDFSDPALLGYHSTSHWPSEAHPSLHDAQESQSSSGFFLGSSSFFDDAEEDGWSPLAPPPNDHALTLDNKPPSSSSSHLPILFPPCVHSEEADLDLDLGFIHPHSPSISTPDLVPSHDLEDEFDDPYITSPSSPSLRSFAELDPVDDYGSDISFFSPPSPAPSLLSLPGADDDEQEQTFADDVDETEEPLEVPEFPSSLESLPSHSLLLIDQDPQSQSDELSSLSPPPRPSSPDHFHIDVDPTSVSCPASEGTVLSKLVDLRKRSQDAEKKGKMAEQQLADATSSSPGYSGGVNNTYLRNQIRMQRKRDKERSKEISALLRLKLAEFEAREGKEKEEDEKPKETSPVTSMTKLVEGGHGRNNKSPRLPKVSPSKTVISSMPQLVARMTFRRRDSGNGKPVVHQHNYSHYQAQPPWRSEGAKPRVASPLKKGFAPPTPLAKGGEVGEAEDEEGEDDDDDEEYLFSMKGLPNDI